MHLGCRIIYALDKSAIPKARIVTQSAELNNPQAFTEKALEIIARNRHSLAIDGISYIKLAGEEYYAQEIFESEELVANLDRNAVGVQNSIYDHVSKSQTALK